MFSALTKLADKPFIVGYFLPVLLAAICFVYTAPESYLPTLKDLSKTKDIGDLTFFVLAVWTFSVLLTEGNYWMYRALEGYFGPLNSKNRLKNRQERHMYLINKISTARFSWQKKLDQLIDTKNPSEAQRIEERTAYDQYLALLYTFRKRYPKDISRVRPTRFGNTIVAFESYPLQVYGAESITFWPRLQAAIPKDFAASLTDAKSQVDLFVNGKRTAIPS
ncbi:hypothetical protein DR64_116 [Paraburkholderia xenovorans LB400]|uniref:Transmembrane protein n=1 Tax=Paraburkholderia xenovorans (strain LB400) TaxID=266265 RepID=Q13ZD9_PARXL|nr:hypothetical protein [Paraburkholderia xenovorans]ABE30550.1 hypothetical protein Bxe_A2419 [Paraburkholderia xenovorans LB400]AIP32742.1 hypothetical protein DR64_116 [Paraburkholderia xenovorans LB400]